MASYNAIVDGGIELWAAGAPSDFDTQVTNTTLTQLSRDHPPDDPRRFSAIALYRGSRFAVGPYVFEGESSLRAELTAAAAVDDFRIFSLGATAALTGASTRELLYRPYQRHVFRFAARGTDGSLIRVRFALRSVVNAILGSIRAQSGSVPSSGQKRQYEVFTSATLQTIDFGLTPNWRKYGMSFFLPERLGVTLIEHAVFSISNGSAGADQGAQVIELDELEFSPLEEQEEV